MSAYPTDRLIEHDGKLVMLYSGGNTKHNGELPDGVTTSRHAILAASCRPGRFAGLATRPRCVGSLVLRPFIPVSDGICLDADIRGSITAELRDPYGRALDGYSLADSLPLTGDSSKHALRWQDDRTTVVYQLDAVALRLEIRDATLYSVRI